MLFGYSPSVIRQYLLDQHLIDATTLAASDPWAIYNAARAFNVTGPELDSAVPEWAATGLSAQAWLAQNGLYLPGVVAEATAVPTSAILTSAPASITVPGAGTTTNNYYPATPAPAAPSGFANDTPATYVPMGTGDPGIVTFNTDGSVNANPGASSAGGLSFQNPYVLAGLAAAAILMLNKKRAH